MDDVIGEQEYIVIIGGWEEPSVWQRRGDELHWLIPYQPVSVSFSDADDPLAAISTRPEFRGKSLVLYRPAPPAGKYYPRVRRSVIRATGLLSPVEPDDGHDATNARIQITRLIKQTESIFETVHPVEENMNSYGHAIRELLIIACTEVENQWSSILRANHYREGRWTTNDYVKLNKAMKLDTLSARFIKYGWLTAVSPFSGWSINDPTNSLAWYAAYNKVKHGRDTNFEYANLRHALSAVCAAHLIVGVQFGFSGIETQDTFFAHNVGALWEPEERYVPVRPEDAHLIGPVDYTF